MSLDTSAPIKIARTAQQRSGASATTIVGFSISWSALISALTVWHIIVSEQGFTDRTVGVLAVFSIGSVIGAAIAWLSAGWIGRLRPQISARFAAMFVALTLGTAGSVALLFFFKFRAYYALFHDSTFSFHWAVQNLVTGVNAAYLFGIAAPQILLPWGLPLIFIASGYFAWYGSART